MDITRPTYMEVNLDNFQYNVEQIKSIIGKNVDIMPVIKANGYGTYINTRVDILEQFNIVGVATVDEGVFLRKIGFKKEIFVLNQPYKSEIFKIAEYDLTIGISSDSFAEELAKLNKNVIVHIEIGTGMGRTGIHPFKVEKYIRKLSSNVIIDGIYTHFSSPDIDYDYTLKQINSFNSAIDMAKKIIGEIRYIHASASNALLNFPEARYNLVRPGIILYGYPAEENTYEKIDLKPIAKLKSKIIFLKEVSASTSIGYGRSFITNKNTKVATVPLGYADGFRRSFSNGWEVLINNKKVPIIGKICMDSFMVDVSEIENVKIGDEVIIWDNENIKLEELAQKCDTINYEILSTISSRVPRKFVV